MDNIAIKQSKQRLKPQKYAGEFYKKWLDAQKRYSPKQYRDYVLCDPLPREDQAHLDSIAQEARK